MLKVLVLAAQNNVADARMEYLIRDRLSWLRFLGFDLGAPTPDANTIRLFRQKLTEAGALDTVLAAQGTRLSRHGRADRRCDAGSGFQATQRRA
ncbi:transposase, partial [Sphingobium bisphenolivorans]|uniref:transposase n=1 Tax=Sphingobium bisphenolivorans TaxID=1335760 RepID=UPI001930C55E